jgi:hypothetical protein
VDVCEGFDDNIDSDSDGTADGCDSCPNDADNDLDNDGDCGDVDVCPEDIENDADNDGVCESDEVLGCTDINAGNYNPDATENQGCSYDYEIAPDEFSFNVSSQLASYFVNSITIDGVLLDAEDWVAAFYNDTCVGAQRWDTQSCLNGICDITVYGDEGTDLTDGYIVTGETPTFKIFDYSSGSFYDVLGPDTEGDGVSDAGVEPWSFLGFSIINQLAVIKDRES